MALPHHTRELTLSLGVALARVADVRRALGADASDKPALMQAWLVLDTLNDWVHDTTESSRARALARAATLAELCGPYQHGPRTSVRRALAHIALAAAAICEGRTAIAAARHATARAVDIASRALAAPAAPALA